MGLATLVAVLAGTFAILGSMISLFLWLRTEANADRRNFQEIQREDRKDLLQLTRNMENTIQAIQQDVKAIQEDIRDFHGRMIAIEMKKFLRK